MPKVQKSPLFENHWPEQLLLLHLAHKNSALLGLKFRSSRFFTYWHHATPAPIEQHRWRLGRQDFQRARLRQRIEPMLLGTAQFRQTFQCRELRRDAKGDGIGILVRVFKRIGGVDLRVEPHRRNGRFFEAKRLSMLGHGLRSQL